MTAPVGAGAMEAKLKRVCLFILSSITAGNHEPLQLETRRNLWVIIRASKSRQVSRRHHGFTTKAL